ncbi:MAG TPA: DUF4383 domain-containing protein [Candidatus Saccharimonadales bacterium]|nr:DUF4383 domain-containing protein [Candidatus Saccharimonadales bacterium]
MNAKSTAMWVGLVILVVGVVGFIPALVPGGKVLGLFLVDPLHNIVHILTGVLAIFAAKSSESTVKTYFKVFGVVYALVTVLGFISSGGTGVGTGLFGLLPVNIYDNLLHLIIAALYLYIGFGGKSSAAKA